MKWASTVTESLDLDTAIDQISTALHNDLDQQPDLLFIFASEHHQTHYADIAARLRKNLTVAGCWAVLLAGLSAMVRKLSGIRGYP
jgi:hypothetical protein